MTERKEGLRKRKRMKNGGQRGGKERKADSSLKLLQNLRRG